MVLELLEAVAVLGDILLVVGALGDPHVGNGLQDGGVGAHAGADPLVGVLHGGVVVEGVDVDELHAHLLQPPAPQSGLLSGVAAAGGVGVGGPADHGLHVLHGHLQHIIGLGAAQTPVVAVGVGGAPVEALPGVGVIGHTGVAHHGEEALEQGDLVAHQAPAVVRGGAGGDGLLAVGLVQTLDLAGHQAQRLIPGGAAVAGLAAVLGVAVLAVGGLHEVLADQGVLQAVIGIGLVPLAVAQQGHGDLALRGVLLAPGLDDPAGGIVVGEDDGADTADHTVDGVQRHGAADAHAVGDALSLAVRTHVDRFHTAYPPYFTSTI